MVPKITYAVVRLYKTEIVSAACVMITGAMKTTQTKVLRMHLDLPVVEAALLTETRTANFECVIRKWRQKSTSLWVLCHFEAKMSGLLANHQNSHLWLNFCLYSTKTISLFSSHFYFKIGKLGIYSLPKPNQRPRQVAHSRIWSKAEKVDNLVCNVKTTIDIRQWLLEHAA